MKYSLFVLFLLITFTSYSQSDSSFIQSEITLAITSYESDILRVKTIIQPIYDRSEQIKNPKLKWQIVNLLACFHKDTDNLDSARIYFIEALEIAKLYKDKLVPTYVNLGLLMRKLDRYEESIEYFNKAEMYILNKSLDSTFLYYVYYNRSLTHTIMGDTLLGLMDLKKTTLYLESDTAKWVRVYAEIAYANLHYNLDSMYYYLSRASFDTYLKSRPILQFENKKIWFYYYTQIGAHKKAISTLVPVLPLVKTNKSYYQWSLGHKLLSEAYEELGMMDSSLYHYKISTAIEDTIYRSGVEKEIAKIEKKYNNVILQKENLELSFKNERKTYTIITIILLSLIVIVIVLYLFVRSKGKANLEILKKNQTEQNLKKDIINSHEKIQEYFVKLEEYNGLIEDLMVIVKSDKSSDAKIKALKTELNTRRSQFEFQELKQSFDQIHPYFLSQLTRQHPTLTEADLKIALLSKLNMKSKEMAVILRITPASVDVSKHRLKRKMNLKRGVSLQDFLNAIN